MLVGHAGAARCSRRGDRRRAAHTGDARPVRGGARAGRPCVRELAALVRRARVRTSRAPIRAPVARAERRALSRALRATRRTGLLAMCRQHCRPIGPQGAQN